MSVQAWPFLIGRSETQGYSVLVSPHFITAQRQSSLLAKAAVGDESAPKTATYREIHSNVLGNISIVYRIIKATGQYYDIEKEDMLKDEGGRPIQLMEGFVVNGRIDNNRQIVVTEEVFNAVHEQVKSVYREFWYTTDSTFPEWVSQPFSLPDVVPDKMFLLQALPPLLDPQQSQTQLTQDSSLKDRVTQVSSREDQVGNKRIWSNWQLWIAAAIGLILVIVGLGLYIYTPDPQTTLKSFCSDLRSAKYNDAYASLSTTAKKSNVVSTLALNFKNVKSCTIQSQSGSTQQAQLVVTYKNGCTEQVNVTLVEEGFKSPWVIDSIKLPSNKC
jgi:hypothetical protein